MENILSYFGTYTPAADGAIAGFQFEYLTSLALPPSSSSWGGSPSTTPTPLRKFAIPAPVVSGLLFSILVAAIKGSGIIALSFNVGTIKDLCQNVFFMCVAMASAPSC